MSTEGVSILATWNPTPNTRSDRATPDQKGEIWIRENLKCILVRCDIGVYNLALKNGQWVGLNFSINQNKFWPTHNQGLCFHPQGVIDLTSRQINCLRPQCPISMTCVQSNTTLRWIKWLNNGFNLMAYPAVSIEVASSCLPSPQATFPEESKGSSY